MALKATNKMLKVKSFYIFSITQVDHLIATQSCVSLYGKLERKNPANINSGCSKSLTEYHKARKTIFNIHRFWISAVDTRGFSEYFITINLSSFYKP